MALELKVDRIRCDGAGVCAELLPELVELDDWGYPIVQPGAIDERLTALARRAVDACPVLALRLVAARAREAATMEPVRRHESIQALRPDRVRPVSDAPRRDASLPQSAAAGPSKG